MNFNQSFQQKENECIIDEGQSFPTENLKHSDDEAYILATAMAFWEKQLLRSIMI